MARFPIGLKCKTYFFFIHNELDDILVGIVESNIQLCWSRFSPSLLDCATKEYDIDEHGNRSSENNVTFFITKICMNDKFLNALLMLILSTLSLLQYVDIG